MSNKIGRWQQPAAFRIRLALPSAACILANSRLTRGSYGIVILHRRSKTIAIETDQTVISKAYWEIHIVCLFISDDYLTVYF